MSDNPRAKIGGNNPPSTEKLMEEKHAPLFKRRKAWLAKAKAADLKPKTPEDCAKLEDLFAEGRDLANDADRVRAEEKEPHLKAGKEIDAIFFGKFRDDIGADAKAGGLARDILQAAVDRRAAIIEAEQAAAAKAAEKAAAEAQRLEAKGQSQDEQGKSKDADLTFAQADAAQATADRLSAQAAAPLAQASRTRTGSGRSVAVDKKLVCTNIIRDQIDLEKLRPYFDHDAIVKAVQAGLKMQAFTELKGAVIESQNVGRVR